MRSKALLLMLMLLNGSALTAQDCEPVRLERSRNLIDGEGTAWGTNYQIRECPILVVDISGYAAGGSELRGREAATFLEVTFLDGFSKVYTYVSLKNGEKLVRISPKDGTLEEGSPIPAIRSGQLIKLSVGLEEGDRFERYFLSSVDVE